MKMDETLSTAILRTIQVGYSRTLQRKSGFEKFELAITLEFPEKVSYEDLPRLYEEVENKVHKLVQEKSKGNKRTEE